jgi:AraC-like DNA-binding protein
MEWAAELKLDRQDPHQLLLREVCSFIEGNLWDPALNPGQIARAHFVSVRHLHSLFSEQGITVSDWIRKRRLEECRNDLSSPVFSQEPVANIALRHGFLDAAHFSRLFRRTFGETPSGFRARIASTWAPEAGAPGGDNGDAAAE